jgi:hypothetical protein
MKKLYILIFCILIGKVHAQNFAPRGATWYYSYATAWFTNGYIKMVTTGDTILNGISSQILDVRLNAYNGSSDTWIENQHYQTNYVSSDSDHVYLWRDSIFIMLYDFSVSVGDTIETYHSFPDNIGSPECDSIGRAIVTDIGFENINGLSLRWYEIEDLPSSPIYATGRIYERIGSTHFFLGEPGTCVTFWEENIDFLRCYSDSVFGEYQSTELPCDFITSIEANTLGVSFQMFPNPTSRNTHIEWDKAIQIESISIVNLSGSQVYHSENLAKSSTAINIDVHDFSPGMYFVELITGEGERASKKLIIE